MPDSTIIGVTIPTPLKRGMSYLFVFGLTANKTTFFSLVDVFGNVVWNQAYPTTTALSSYAALANFGTMPNGAVSAGGFSGSVSNAFMAWGSMPCPSGTTTATAAFTTSSGNTISVASVPAGIAAGQSILDTTSGNPVGTVASWTSSSITISQANPLYASSGASDALTIGYKPTVSGGAAYGNGTLDLVSLATGKLGVKDFVAGVGASLRYFLPLAGPGGDTVKAQAAFSSGSTFKIGATTTASAAATPGVGVTTLSVAAIPAGAGPNAVIFDVTTGSQVGTIKSISGTTITIIEVTLMSAVGSGDTLLIGNVPGSIRAGQLIFDVTTKLQVGTVASWNRANCSITISQANPLNAVAAGDSLLIGGNTPTTGAITTSSGPSIAGGRRSSQHRGRSEPLRSDRLENHRNGGGLGYGRAHHHPFASQSRERRRLRKHDHDLRPQP